MKETQTELRDLLADTKRLLDSAREDYSQKSFNTYSYFVSECNSLLQRAQDVGVAAELAKIGEAERDEVEHHSWSSASGPYRPPMIPSIGSKMRKLREVINSADKLLMKLASITGIDINNTSPITLIDNLCRKFHVVASQLRVRRSNRPTLDVEDEYDVQDLLHALLRLHFEDVRPEEWTPSYAGGSARMDFLLKQEQIVIEAKKTRKGLGAKELGEQLIIDIEKYAQHPDCKSLVCFVYDPDARVANPRGVEADLNSGSDERIKIITFIKPRSS